MSGAPGSGCGCSGVCGCFEGITARTPVAIANRPGLATIRYRMEQWKPDAILYVVDHRQSLHFQQLFQVVLLL